MADNRLEGAGLLPAPRAPRRGFPVWAFVSLFAAAAGVGSVLLLAELNGEKQPAGKVGAARPAPDAPAQPLTEAQRQSQQHYLSGVVFFQKGDYGKAQAEWTLACRLDPANVDAQAGLKRLAPSPSKEPAR